MAISYVKFDLQDGFIDHWLAAGPQALAVENIPNPQDLSAKAQIAQQNFDQKSGISGQPVERGPLEKGKFQIGDYEGEWKYSRCREDHFVNHSTTCPIPSFLRSWAYTQLVSAADQTATFRLTSFGPVDVWINKKSVCHTEQFSDQPTSLTFQAALDEGNNKVLVRFAGVAAPDCQLAVALHVQGKDLTIQIPSLIPSISRRNELEAVNALLYLDRDVYAAGDTISLCWPEGLEKEVHQDVRLQTPRGQIYGQVEDMGKAGQTVILGSAAALNKGPYQAFVMPRAWEMYESQIRVTQALDLYVMGLNRFSDGPYGTMEERTREALLDAAHQKNGAAHQKNGLFSEIATMALGAWLDVDEKVFQKAVESIQQRQTGSEITLLGLLGALLRFGKKAKFPAALKDQIKDCALNYRYGADEPGCDGLRFDLESRQIIFYTCKILAGQLYPTQVFTNSGLTGKKHRAQGEALALAWMKTRGENGFADWDSKEGYEAVLTALAHLVDLAKTEAVWDLGSVLLDKIFFTIALNSYKGVFGTPQGRANTAGIKCGLLEATSGITRLMWGMGIFNEAITGTVSLAMMENYELPPIIADIAAGLPGEMWGREQAAAAGSQVNKVTYRTPDYMLSSAQDYRPGARGSQEHIWQATLGPKSILFVNHPGCASENEAAAPNFWRGNGVLPRVAQVKDSLIAIYNLPEDAWMGFTHAYFPTIEFDAWTQQGNTIFARQGSGYLALTAAQGLEMVKTGPTAFRELRSYGRQNAWVCQMGREAVDGDFAAFQEKVLANIPVFDGLQVTCQTPRGDKLTFGWEGPLTLNGEEQPLSGYKHYENPFTTTELPGTQMEIQTEDYLLRLKFGELA